MSRIVVIMFKHLNSTWKLEGKIERSRRRMYRLLFICILVGISKKVEGFSVRGLSGSSLFIKRRHSFTSNRNVHLQTWMVATDAPVVTPDGVETPIEVMPRRWRKATKQLATLGPASSNFEMIEKLFLSGADIFRLNFSHGEHAEKAKLVEIIREVEKKYNHPIAILADLQGPKLRVGTFDGDGKVVLVEGQSFSFDLKEDLGDNYRVRLPHPEILNTLRANDILLLDDGKLKMKVTETTMQEDGENGKVVCEVVIGGKLSTKKGVNTPSIILPISPLTPKDLADLDFILTLDVDWVALSFVQKPEDIIEIKSIIKKSPTNSHLKVMAKLEKPSAIDYLDEIVDQADGIMVARGDLGVEMNPWDVPVIQKRITETSKMYGKPCVIATQMMESMIEAPTPTRAEASDCAVAVFDSADAVMLSAESAAGKYPVESVTMQQLIINKVESDEVYRDNLDRFAQETTVRQSTDAVNTAITLAVRQTADISKSKAIVAFTSSGGTVMRVSKLRPTVPIIAGCYDIKVARQLAIAWGVYPVVLGPHKEGKEFNLRDEIEKVCIEANRKKFSNPEVDTLTISAGLPFGFPGTTNVVRVVSAAGPDVWFDDEGNLKNVKEFNLAD